MNSPERFLNSEQEGGTFRIYYPAGIQNQGVQKHILGQSGPLAHCLATKGGGQQQIDTVKIAHQ